MQQPSVLKFAIVEVIGQDRHEATEPTMLTEGKMPTDDELLSGRDKELWFEAEALWEADHPKIPFRETFVSREGVASDAPESATEGQRLEYLRRALANREPPPAA